MFRFYRNWKYNRIIRKSSIKQEQWRVAIEYLPLLKGLSQGDLTKLQNLATVFIYQKNFIGTHDTEVSLEMAQVIALQACLPILHLGLGWYDGWSDIIVYPDVFYPERHIMDDDGVVHRVKEHLSGEAWLQGPVVLAWSQVENSGQIDGENLVIHEFAHKLDMSNGHANGFPVIHRSMSYDFWFESMSHAYNDLREKINAGKPVCIDNYAATEPAEFFAVLSEVFFERPEIINRCYPAVYKNFREFYKQDTLARLQHL